MLFHIWIEIIDFHLIRFQNSYISLEYGISVTVF